MKIGIIKCNPHIEASSGVRIQALTWKLGLEKFGHTIHLLDIWNEINWNEYDVFLLFEYGGLLKQWVELLKKFKARIVLAPIIDTNTSVFLFGLSCRYLGFNNIKLHSKFNDLYLIKDDIDAFLVRSNYEKKFIEKGLGVKDKKIHIVPLPYRFKSNETNFVKENFCFHVSRLASKNKNVERLVNAAKKYKFDLVLAGTLNGSQDERWLSGLIGDSRNISYVGRLDDKALCQYYSRAKVFALPSIFEGVGLVALEAALFGCEVVITEAGGPREYFEGYSALVNPFDTNQIGSSIMLFLNGTVSYQPQLRMHILKNYSLEKTMKTLNATLLSI